MGLVFVDCEAVGPCPGVGELTEFGAVAYPFKAVFHGVLAECEPDPANPALSRITGRRFDPVQVFTDFENWLKDNTQGRPVFVSDNPAYDFQWISYGFWTTLNRNPFGHSGRRIGDFYAGLVGDFYQAQAWKKLRVTPHDHNPVHDAMGNVEAFERLLRGER
ncbi:MAG TPA: exonuclease [Blastocatellia bacterium]|nr:exonuclease [Blastocatellia bacterium]